MAQKKRSNVYAIEIIMEVARAKQELESFIRFLESKSKSNVKMKRAKKLAIVEDRAIRKRINITMKEGKRIRITKKNEFKINNALKTAEKIRLASKKSVMEQSKTNLNEINKAIIHIKDNISRLNSSISAHPSSLMSVEFKDHFIKLMDNLNIRFARSFRSGSRRHEMAINDPSFYQFAFLREEGKMIARFANTQLLDECTSIYINRYGEMYDPPGDYSDSNIEGFWKFWEYTGVGPKEQFTSPRTFWIVMMKGWMNKNHYSAKPFITNYGKMFQEDEELINQFLNTILVRLFRRLISQRYASSKIASLDL